MASESWGKIKNRLSPLTVQELLDHTEEIDRRMEKVLVGVFNDMVEHRAQVNQVVAQLATVTELANTCRELEQSARQAADSVQDFQGELRAHSTAINEVKEKLNRFNTLLIGNLLLAVSAIVIAVIR
jgi:DNA repair ATPase RecN